MSIDSMVREVFEQVEADPDAILEAFGGQSPEDLIEDADRGCPTRSGVRADGGERTAERSVTLGTDAEVRVPGAHAPTRDEQLDADDAVANTLFGDLSSVSLERVGDSTRERRTRDRTDDGGCADLEAIPADVFVGEPTVVVNEGDGLAIDQAISAGDPPSRSRSRAGESRSRSVQSHSARASQSAADQSEFTFPAAESDCQRSSSRPSGGSSHASSQTSGESPSDESSTDGLTLVGRTPEPVRIGDDAFGNVTVGDEG